MDAEQRAGLAIIRSLGCAGHTVYACSNHPAPIGGASRYVRATLPVVDGLRDPARLAEQVRALIPAYGIDTLIPVSEASLLAMLPYRDALPGVCVPFPDVATFRRICDKSAVLEEARHVGIATPEQTVLATANDAFTVDPDALAYPLVVKPARSVGGAEGNQAKFLVRYAEHASALRTILANTDPRAYPLLLQQRIVGPGIGIFVLLWDGQVMATFAHRRIREHPPAGGVSVYSESVPMDQSLLNKSIRLLQAFNWRGVAMVECKVDQATGTPYLMEVNGRFWGSLQLAIAAGVDFPAVLLRAAHGGVDQPVTNYSAGVRNRWVWGDVNHLVTRLRHSDRELALPSGFPSRWQTVWQMLRDVFAHGTKNSYETSQRGDMRPFWRETRQWFQALGK
jgi:predicted ATP-grasp superfamily ATP-dependent carboligase